MWVEGIDRISDEGARAFQDCKEQRQSNRSGTDKQAQLI